MVHHNIGKTKGYVDRIMVIIKGGNSAEQSISQSQTSNQNNHVVSGGDKVGSGNNVNVQSQTNTGSNAAAQG